MGVKLAAASGGSIELVPTNTASAFTVTVPASTGTMATTESTLTQFNVSGSAPVYACRAWVNFNGTGTVAIRASGNVSSITDNGVGDYTINFTTAMPDANYSAVGMVDSPTSNIYSISGKFSFPPTTTTLRVSTGLVGIAFADVDIVNISIFR